MSFIRISRRIFVQPTLSKVDVEAIYRDILGPLGGDSYTNGVLSGPFNGSLDHRNFSAHAGFTNTAKNTKTSIYPVQIRVAAPPLGISNYYAALPFIGDGVSPPLSPEIRGWSLAYGSGGPCSGTASLYVNVPGVGNNQLLYSGPWTNVGPLAPLVTVGLFPIFSSGSGHLPAQSQFRVELNITGGTVPKDLVSLIWLRSVHVR